MAWSEVAGGKFLNGMRDMRQKHSFFFLDNLIPNSLHSQLSLNGLGCSGDFVCNDFVSYFLIKNEKVNSERKIKM